MVKKTPLRLYNPKPLQDSRMWIHGWSQKELAQRAGINRRTVWKVEAGTAGFSSVSKCRLVLGVAPHELRPVDQD